jgi:hypothetical protein
MLEFEDGTKQMVHRGDHERHGPKPGDMWSFGLFCLAIKSEQARQLPSQRIISPR